MTATGVATLLGKQLFSIRLPQRCSSLAVWTQLRTKSDATDVGWDYETERKTFSLKAPEYYNFARDVVDKWAEKEKTGERNSNPALWWVNEKGDEIKWNFQHLSQKSKEAANVLTGPCKLKAGDVAIVILPRVPEWWVINISAIRAGIILSSGTPLLRANDIQYRLNASGAKCIITNAACADYVDEVAANCPGLETKVVVGTKRLGWLTFEDLMLKTTDNFQCINTKALDPMTIFFTSGTTGPPKMTEHTHSSYGLGHLITARYFLDINSNDVIWNLSDTGWAKSAWSSFFAPWINGACVFAQDSSKFDPTVTLKVLSRYPLTHFCAPPTAIRYMVKEKLTYANNSNLRRCIGAGEPVNPEVKDEWKDITGHDLQEGYGQTETTFLCGTYPSIGQRPGSMGKPAPGIDLQIVDTEGTILPAGTEGEIGIRCRPERPVGLFSRYIDDEKRMETSFVGDFYLTGDRATMDEEGYVYFVGRSDDVIMSAGYRIGPFEVESALLEHPAVLESAVVSSPDPFRGEAVKAFIVLTELYKDVDKDKLMADIQEHTKNITAPYKYPRKIEFVESLPKTVSGKTRRVELRNKEWGRPND